MEWRRAAAAAIVVAGVVGTGGPRTAGAAPRSGGAPGKGAPDPSERLEDVGDALVAFVTGGWIKLARQFLDDPVPPILDQPEPPPEVNVEDILEEIGETESAWGDLLREANVDWRDEVEAVRKNNAAIAAEQTAAGTRSEADDLYVAGVTSTLKLRASLGKSLAPVRKVIVASGRPVAIVGPLTRDPQHPVRFVEGFIPFYFPLLVCAGRCDGRATVMMLDPSFGQDAGVEASFLQFVGPNSPDVAAELPLTRSVDFPDAEKPEIFQFSGLAPGDYVVRAGALVGGLHVVTGTLVVTIPSWDPENPPPDLDRDLAKQAKALGLRLQRFVKKDGATFVREMKSVAAQVKRNDLTPEDGFVAGTEAVADLRRLFRDRQLAGVVEVQGLFADLAASDPAAADREASAGTGASADVLDAYQRSAAALVERYTVQGTTLLRKASLKVGAPFSVAPRGTPRTRHPLAATNAAGGRDDETIQVFARCDGTLRVLVRDPRDFGEIDNAYLQVRDGAGHTVVTRELVDLDFGGGDDDEDVGLVELTGLSPGSTYSVRLVTGHALPLGVLDEAVVTVPDWRGDEPAPPACDRTTGSVTHDGAAIFVPPLQKFEVGFQGNAVQSITLVFRDPAKPTQPSVHFGMLTTTPIDLDGPLGEEWITTIPPRVHGLSAFVYDPVTFYFTSAASGTFTVRNLRNLALPSGCAEVIIDAVTTEGDPVRFRFTLHTDQLQ